MQLSIQANVFLVFFSLLIIGPLQAQKDSEESDPEKKERAFIVVEDKPEFPGGESAMKKFIREHVQYPEQAKDNGVKGSVYVKFIVEKDGSLSNIQVIKGLGSGCDKEAKRVVKEMPEWEPGQQRGRAVRVFVRIPVHFPPEDDRSTDR